MALIVCSIGIAPKPSSAASYETWSSRGVKHLAYSKNILYWSTTSTKIKKANADQTRSGLFIVNLGAKKITSLSTSTKIVYNFKNEFLAGAEIGGVTLGWADTIIDQVKAYRSGSRSWRFDI